MKQQLSGGHDQSGAIALNIIFCVFRISSLNLKIKSSRSLELYFFQLREGDPTSKFHPHDSYTAIPKLWYADSKAWHTYHYKHFIHSPYLNMYTLSYFLLSFDTCIDLQHICADFTSHFSVIAYFGWSELLVYLCVFTACSTFDVGLSRL